MEDAVHCNSNGFVMGVDRFWVMPDQVKSKHPVEGRGAIQIMLDRSTIFLSGFAPKASTPSRKSSEPRRPVFKIELKPQRSAMTLSLPANRCTGHVILSLDRLTRHAAQMDR